MFGNRSRGVMALVFAVAITCTVLVQVAQSPTVSASSGYNDAYSGGYNAASDYQPPSTGGVDDGSGIYGRTFTDVSIPGRGPAIDFTRTYSSDLYAQQQSIGVGSGLFGWGWASSYGMEIVGSGQYPTVIQENGSPVTFAQTTQNGHTTETPPSWASMTLTNNQDGTWTMVRRNQQTFVFGYQGGTRMLESISDPNGYKTTFTYSGGQLTTVTDPAGRTLTFAYGSNGRVSSVTDPLGRVTTYGYDSSTNLTSVTQPGGQITTFTYDSNHDLLTTTDPNGDVTTNVYDSNGRVTSQSDPLGRSTTFSYSQPPGQNGTTTITDPHGSVTQENYTVQTSSQNNFTMMQLTSRTAGFGTSSAATWTYGYQGLTPHSVTDPNGHVTKTAYNSSGDLTSTTDGLGQITGYTYNSLNEPLVTTDPLGITTNDTYDSGGNLTSSVKLPSGSALNPSWTNSSSGIPSWSSVSNEALSCTGTFCIALRNAGSVAVTDNPTATNPTWTTSSNSIPSWNSVSKVSVACTPTWCVAVGSGGKVAVTTNPGNANPTWTDTNAIPSWSSVSNVALSCTPGFCVAGSTNGAAAVTDNPTAGNPTWSDDSNTIPISSSSLSLSCTTAFCLAIGGNGEAAVTHNPTTANPTWPADVNTVPNSPLSVSCTEGLCVTQGSGGAVAISQNPSDTGATWTSTNTIPSFYSNSGPVTACTMASCMALSYATRGGQVTSLVATTKLPSIFGTNTSYFHSDTTHPGDVSGSADPNGNVTTFTYDTYGDQATKTTYPSPGVSDTTQDVYDADGEKLCEASPNAVAQGITCPANGARVAGTTTWTYDADGRVTSETDADGNTTSYGLDGDGNQLTVTDPLGNVTKTVFDSDNRVVSTTAGYGTAAASTTTNTYDIVPASCPSAPSGTLWCSQVSNGLGNTTTSYFNVIGQMVEQAPPNTTAQTPTTYTYDGAGNLLTTTNGAGTTTDTYDADNHLTGVSYSNTASGYTQPSAVTYAYDSDGSRTKMTDGTGTTTYTYDGLERLISVKDGAANTVSYGYDPASNLICLSYPNSGPTTCQNASSGTGLVAYQYNATDQMTQMTDWLGNATEFGYDGDSNLTGITLPSGTATSIAETYDPTDALIDTSTTTSGTKTDLATLTRNADKLIASTTAPATTYGYNSLNQVTTGTTSSYTYDAAGDLTSTTPNGGSTSSDAYNNDGQLCWTGPGAGTCSSPPSGAVIFAYDTTGDRLSEVPSGGNPTTYGWDQSGNLVCETASNSSGYSCANPNSATTNTYAYNGDHLRMSDAPAGGSAQQFTWNVTSSIPVVLEDGTNYYLYGPSIGAIPIEQIGASAGTPSYLLSDTIGVREQMSNTGTIIGSMMYDSFGNPCSGCSIGTPFGFAGGYTDSTGNLYLFHRYYDPVTSQFLSVDPISIAPTHGSNFVNVATLPPNQSSPGSSSSQSNSGSTAEPYGYTDGDPVNRTDPNGECWWFVPGFLCALYDSALYTWDTYLANHTIGIAARLSGLSATIGKYLSVIVLVLRVGWRQFVDFLLLIGEDDPKLALYELALFLFTSGV